MTERSTAGVELGERLVARYRDRDPNGIVIGEADGLVDANAWLEDITGRDDLIALAKALDAGVVLVVIHHDHPLRDELVDLALSDEACMDTLEGRPWGVVTSGTAPLPPVMLILDPLANGPMPAGWRPGDPKPEAGQ